MGIIEVMPGASFGTLTVKGREGSFNGEITWRCEDEKGRSVVFPESEIVAMYVAPEEVVPEVEPEMDNLEVAKEEEVEALDDSPAETEAKDEVPGGAAVAQSEPEQEEEKAEEVKPEPEEKKSFFGKKNKKNKGRK